MSLILLAKALVMSVVEGLTEFLPISSTGHLIITGDLLHFTSDKIKAFEIVIQSGAMFALIWEYRVKLWGVVKHLPTDRTAQQFTFNLAVAFVPAAVLGLAFHKAIEAKLFAPVPVALAFAIGGVIMIWAERRTHTVRITDVDAMGWRDALKVGFAQCFALIPGTSRAGATIIGGLLFGLSRQAATEFSFFLAIPTLLAAGGYQLYEARSLLAASDVGLFTIGTIGAFFSALLCVRWLLRYISRHDFAPFGWYRIVLGGVVLLTAYTGLVEWVAR